MQAREEALMMAGDHIRIQQSSGSQHGIDVGDRTAIVFDHGVGPRRVRLEPLPDGARVEVVTHIERVYAPKQVVARAFSRFSEAAFAAMFADSEAFAVWCKTGRPAPTSFTSPAPAISGELRAPGEPRAPAEARVRKAKAKAKPKAAKKPASPPKATRKKAAPRKAVPEPAASRRKVKERPVTARASAPPKPRAGGKAAARPGKTRKQPARGGAKAPRRSRGHPHRG
jgi:hypothetical protein